MAESIAFETVYKYDTLQSGITVLATLLYEGQSCQIRAKVDTGAENCIFERKHGERLGIEIETGTEQTFGTVTGTFVTYRHELRIRVLGIETFSAVYFAKDESYTRNVLGRQGWLDRVKLGLVDYDEKLFLSAYDE